MSTFCPNLRNSQVKQDFNQLVNMVGENIAYYLWNTYEGDMSLALPRALDILSLMNNQIPQWLIDEVNLVFLRIPDLSKIGTVEQYARYLLSIFPNSLEKHVYWHGSDSDFSEGFDSAIKGKGSGSPHMTGEFYLAKLGWSTLQYVSGVNRKFGPDVNGFNHWNKLWWEMKEIMSNGRRHNNDWKDLVIGPDPNNVRQEIPNKRGVFNRNDGGTNGKFLSERKADYGYENKSDKEFFEEVFGIKYGEDTFNTWAERNAKIFKELESTEKGIYPAIINTRNPIRESGQNTYYEPERGLLTKARTNNNDAILGSNTDNEFHSDVAVVLNPSENVHFLGTTNDINEFRNFVKNDKQGIRRRKNFTATEFAASNRLSSLLRELFPEISVEYVDGIEGGHVGKAEYEALKILVDMFESTLDTEPHEYAHFYIEMFINSKLVQEGIKLFGSKEALVQSVGVRTVEMDGKARTWWLKFKDFIKKLLNKNKYAKEALLAELTDAFLTRSDIGEGVSIYDLLGVDYQDSPSIPIVRGLIKQKAASILYDNDTHSYKDKATGKQMTPVSTWIKILKWSGYDPDSEDAVQRKISDDAREGGTRIHALFESLWLGTYDESKFLKYFTKDALLDAKELINDLKSKYDFVAAEAMLSDVEHDIAGTADLIVRDKKTGKYLLLDYKSKMFSHNGKKTNAKGSKLWGFTWATSKKLSSISLRDKYDLQLSMYVKMLNDMGIPIEEHGIVPIVYAVDGEKISKLMISHLFGGDDSHYNKNLKERRFAKLITQPDVEHMVNNKVFGIQSEDGKDKLRDEMLDGLRQRFETIRRHLVTQRDILTARGRRTRAKQASLALENLNDVQAIEGLFKYVKFGVDLLESINKHLKSLLLQGENATWNMLTLQEYKDIASSYQVIGEIRADIERYSSLLSSETVREMRKMCRDLMDMQQLIISECNRKTGELYMDTMLRYVKNKEIEYREKYEKEFEEKNKRKEGESKAHYNARRDVYVQKKIEENKDEIDHETRVFLQQLANTADAGFEVTSLFKMVNSVLESPDPFVQATVQRYWEIIRKRDRMFLKFQAELQDILTEYRKKYGHSNIQNYRKYYDDFVEVSDEGCYLVNPLGADFVAAMNKAFDEIRQKDISSSEKEAERLKWMDENFPIYDRDAYDKEYQRDYDTYFKDADTDKSLKELKKVLDENNKLPIEKRKTLYQLLSAKSITSDTYTFLKDLTRDLDQKYRSPNPNKYPNKKYKAMMELDKNDPKRKLYEFLLRHSEELDSKFGSHKLRLNYKLPGVMKRGLEVVGQDGVAAAVGDAIKRDSFIMSDDVLRGSYVNQAGIKIDVIPLPFKRSLSEAEQSFDLPTAYAMWYSSAMEYLGKRSIEAEVLKTQQILNERMTDTNKKSLLGGKNKDNKQNVSEKKVNTAEQFNAWVDVVFYGNRLQDLGIINIPFSDKQVDVAKLIKTLVKWQNTRVMTMNYTSWLNNSLVGEVNQLEDVLASRYLTWRSYGKATKIFLLNTTAMAADANRVVPKNKYNRIADYFGLFLESENQSITGFLRHSISDIGHVGQKVGDKFLQVRFLLGMLCEKQAIDKDGNILGDMLDFIDVNDQMELVVDPRVVNFSTEDVDNFTLFVQKVILRNHGNYSQHWSVAMSKMWYGLVGLSLRNWIASTVERRIGREQVDSITNTRFRGFYRTTFKWLFTESRGATSVINFIASMIKDGDKYKKKTVHWSELSNTQKSDLISSAIEFGTAFLAYMLYCLLGYVDDDDDNDVLAMLRYQCYRLYTDLTFYTLPSSFAKILQDPFPTMNLFTDITNTAWLLLSPLEEYNSGKHMFDNKLLDKITKLAPGIKQIHRIDNISAEMEYFIRKS